MNLFYLFILILNISIITIVNFKEVKMKIKKMLKLSVLSLTVMGFCLGVGLLAGPIQSKAMATESNAETSSSLQEDKEFFDRGDINPCVIPFSIGKGNEGIEIAWSDENGRCSTSRTFDAETLSIGLEKAKTWFGTDKIVKLKIVGYTHIKNNSVVHLDSLESIEFRTANGSPYDVNFQNNDADGNFATVRDCPNLTSAFCEDPDFNEDSSSYNCWIAQCPNLNKVEIEGDYGDYGEKNKISEQLNRAIQNASISCKLMHSYGPFHYHKEAYTFTINHCWVRDIWV